jgi:hypothetical protein
MSAGRHSAERWRDETYSTVRQASILRFKNQGPIQSWANYVARVTILPSVRPSKRMGTEVAGAALIVSPKNAPYYRPFVLDPDSFPVHHEKEWTEQNLNEIHKKMGEIAELKEITVVSVTDGAAHRAV